MKNMKYYLLFFSLLWSSNFLLSMEGGRKRLREEEGEGKEEGASYRRSHRERFPLDRREMAASEDSNYEPAPVRYFSWPESNQQETQRRSIHEAAFDGSISEMRELVNNGADARALGGNDAQPLHYSALGLNRAVVDWLLMFQCVDPNARDCNGSTPLDYLLDALTTHEVVSRKHLAASVQVFLSLVQAGASVEKDVFDSYFLYNEKHDRVSFGAFLKSRLSPLMREVIFNERDTSSELEDLLGQTVQYTQQRKLNIPLAMGRIFILAVALERRAIINFFLNDERCKQYLTPSILKLAFRTAIRNDKIGMITFLIPLIEELPDGGRILDSGAVIAILRGYPHVLSLLLAQDAQTRLIDVAIIARLIECRLSNQHISEEERGNCEEMQCIVSLYTAANNRSEDTVVPREEIAEILATMGEIFLR